MRSSCYPKDAVFNAMVTDTDMPDMDGYTLAQ